jgi:hypothetical protein
MRKLRKDGLPAVKILFAPKADALAVKAEFLEGFETLEEVLERAGKNPRDPKVLRQIDALKDYVKRHGRVHVPDLHSANMGFTEIDGKMEFRIVDANETTVDLPPVARAKDSPVGNSLRSSIQQHESKIAAYGKPKTEYQLFQEKEGYVVAETAESVAERKAIVANLKKIEAEVMSGAYPKEFSASAPVKPAMLSDAIEADPICRNPRGAPIKVAIDRTLGTSANVMNFAGIALAVLAPETNPFAGEPIGVPCARAEELKGRTKCVWRAYFNPLDNVALCSTITSVQRTGRSAFMFRAMADQELCHISYDSLGFRVDDGASRSKLKKLGLFDGTGLELGPSYPKTKDLLERLKKNYRITEPALEEDMSVPPRDDFYSREEPSKRDGLPIRAA